MEKASKILSTNFQHIARARSYLARQLDDVDLQGSTNLYFFSFGLQHCWQSFTLIYKLKLLKSLYSSRWMTCGDSVARWYQKPNNFPALSDDENLLQLMKMQLWRRRQNDKFQSQHNGLKELYRNDIKAKRFYWKFLSNLSSFHWIKKRVES